MNVIVSHEWESTQESLKLSWWESQKRIHQIIKIVDKLLNLVHNKERWIKTTVCQLLTIQHNN